MADEPFDLTQYVIPPEQARTLAMEESALRSALEAARKRVYSSDRAKFEHALVKASEVPGEVLDEWYEVDNEPKSLKGLQRFRSPFRFKHPRTS